MEKKEKFTRDERPNLMIDETSSLAKKLRSLRRAAQVLQVIWKRPGEILMNNKVDCNLKKNRNV